MAAKKTASKKVESDSTPKLPGDSFPPGVWDEIVERISRGEPLREICREEGMPSYKVVYDRMEMDDDLASHFARAREKGYDAIAEDCLRIAEDGSNDWMERNDGDNPGYALNGEHVQRSKLRIETRLKLLAKWSPKKYGDKVTTEHTGEGGGAVQVSVNFVKAG